MRLRESAVLNSLLVHCARGLLWGSVVAILVLTFVWPFAVSRDPDQPAFRVAAIAALLGFLAAMLMLLAERLARRR